MPDDELMDIRCRCLSADIEDALMDSLNHRRFWPEVKIYKIFLMSEVCPDPKLL